MEKNGESFAKVFGHMQAIGDWAGLPYPIIKEMVTKR
jgi:hypothetical protein